MAARQAGVRLLSNLLFKVLTILVFAALVIQLLVVWYHDDIVQIRGPPIQTLTQMHSPPELPSIPYSTSPHLFPQLPPLPAHAPIPDAEALAYQTLQGKPTIVGIAAILHRFLLELHESHMELAAKHAEPPEVINDYVKLAEEHLLPLDARYRGKSVFPIREDNSIYLSVAAFRDHLLGETMKEAFSKAANPDKIFIGAIVQNCFGIDYTCKTGAQVVGKNEKGRDITKVSDAPPDINGVQVFCEDEQFKRYCDAGQVRALYVNETESLGPAAARYYASKLWGGETYYVQVDAHLQFAQDWDSLYIADLHAAKSYPKAVLSAYPPGFSGGGTSRVGKSPGTRLCSCVFSPSDVEQDIIRIGTGSSYHENAPVPTQIPFIAAGFFFTRAEFLIDVPFDPLLPNCFMGEEIALSMRAWTSGWDIYAPRVNLIAHQYRPGRMGLPKFWGSVGRTFGRPGPGFNTRLQNKVIQRIKHMVGYPDVTRKVVEDKGDATVLTEIEHYGLGSVRTRDAFIKLTEIDFHDKKCHKLDWCNNGELL